MATELLLFEISDVLFGLDTHVVREVVRAATPAAAPDAPAAVCGVLNLRGRVLRVLNGRRLFALEERDMRVSDHFVVIECGDRGVALHADRAIDLERVDVEPAEAEEASDQLVEGYAKTGLGLAQVLSAAGLLAAAGIAFPAAAGDRGGESA